jgi:hypothetical protein
MLEAVSFDDESMLAVVHYNWQKKGVNQCSPQSSARRQERNYKQYAAENIACI